MEAQSFHCSPFLKHEDFMITKSGQECVIKPAPGIQCFCPGMTCYFHDSQNNLRAANIFLQCYLKERRARCGQRAKVSVSSFIYLLIQNLLHLTICKAFFFFSC